MDEKITRGKSTNLEKSCFEKGLKFLINVGINVVEVVTDAHPQIGALMSMSMLKKIACSILIGNHINSSLSHQFFVIFLIIHTYTSIYFFFKKP